eukprot:CAMPEP_0167801246 /NCGR_PEP_ID=MMETSP0111_2-20121227/18291_1 /TAXON_ID=91324 /ORGANISM="Lotharella globosa, Strain CCCM811" /LENGTH=118 /DNA_ID=CAMNT_0007696817 /DNA_START=208 /DNA_END=561 /DNA_ORIENTATION=+
MSRSPRMIHWTALGSPYQCLLERSKSHGDTEFSSGNVVLLDIFEHNLLSLGINWEQRSNNRPQSTSEDEVREEHDPKGGGVYDLRVGHVGPHQTECVRHRPAHACKVQYHLLFEEELL